MIRVRVRVQLLPLAALAVVAALGASLLVLNPRDGATASSAPTKAQLTALEAQLVPLVQRGGQVIQEGMKPAINDLRYDHVTPAAFMAIEADGWIRTLGQVRAEVRAVAVDDSLIEVRDRVVTALSGYIQAAERLRLAMRATGPEQARMVREGVAVAQAADADYDRGAALLQSARRRLGLPANPYFPDPTHD